MQNLPTELKSFGVIPVIAIDDPKRALGLADALIEGGLPVAEITFRTVAAAEVMRLLTAERPDLLLGAGTVLTTQNADLAKDCGAQFALAPGFNPAIVQHAMNIGLPFCPGVATPSEIEVAMAMGCRVLKFFPAEANGGVKFIKALAGPYKHTGLQLVPTGGVTLANLAEYLTTDCVMAVGGTWIATRDDIAQENWGAVAQRCREVRLVVEKIRGEKG